jgi:hypothetical protein
MQESDAIDHCAWQTKRIRELEQQLAGANSRIAEQASELELLRKMEDAVIEFTKAKQEHDVACESLHNKQSPIHPRLKRELVCHKRVREYRAASNLVHAVQQAAERREAEGNSAGSSPSTREERE